jgi:hypothetical protein
MVWKFMRKLLVVMMGLVILILFEVQANELSFTFFHPSSLPPLELDSCLEKKFVSCGEKLKKRGHYALYRMYYPEFYNLLNE